MSMKLLGLFAFLLLIQVCTLTLTVTMWKELLAAIKRGLRENISDILKITFLMLFPLGWLVFSTALVLLVKTDTDFTKIAGLLSTIFSASIVFILNKKKTDKDSSESKDNPITNVSKISNIKPIM